MVERCTFDFGLHWVAAAGSRYDAEGRAPDLPIGTRPSSPYSVSNLRGLLIEGRLSVASETPDLRSRLPANRSATADSLSADAGSDDCHLVALDEQDLAITERPVLLTLCLVASRDDVTRCRLRMRRRLHMRHERPIQQAQAVGDRVVDGVMSSTYAKAVRSGPRTHGPAL